MDDVAPQKSSWQVAQEQVETRRTAKRDRLAALSPEARKRRKKVRFAVSGAVALAALLVVVGIASAPGASVGVTGWQNPTGKTVEISVKTYDLNNPGDRGTGSDSGWTKWTVQPFETKDASQVVKNVPCRGDGNVGVSVFAFNVDDEHDTGILLDGVAKCGSMVRCGIVLDLDLTPHLSGCQG